jgi:DUF971 family protein
MAWAVGDGVLAWRLEDGYCYPGTVRQCDQHQYFIQFDDGAETWVSADRLRPLSLGPGDRVEVRVPVGRSYSPARVVRRDAGKVIVEHEDGEQECTSLGMVRINPSDVRSTRTAVAASPWITGDRVFGRWGGDWHWYPATVQSMKDGQVHVIFDDGDQEHLPPERVVKLEVRVGQRVLGRWQRGPIYYPGKITRVEGERIWIDYDDGDKEATDVAWVRLAPAAFGSPWKVGQRVLAHWRPAGAFFVGVIRSIQGNAVQIHFDDGDRATITPGEILPLAFAEGMIVFARRKGVNGYVPAQVLQVDDGSLHLRFEDGAREWADLSRICVAPPA